MISRTAVLPVILRYARVISATENVFGASVFLNTAYVAYDATINEK